MSLLQDHRPGGRRDSPWTRFERYLSDSAIAASLSAEMQSGSAWVAYLGGLATLAIATAIGLLLLPRLDPHNVALVYLVAVVVTATRWGLGPSVLVSFLALILFDAVFIPPYGVLSVGSTQNLVTLGAFLFVSIVVSGLVSQIRTQMAKTRRRERELAALYEINREIAFARDDMGIVRAATAKIENLYGSPAVALLRSADGSLDAAGAAGLSPVDLNAARSAFEHGQAAGPGTGRSPDAGMLFLPLKTAQGTFGVLGVRLVDGNPGSDPRRLFEAIASQVAVALENAHLSRQAEQARLLEETEHFRDALLSSISHDLRTPLASILGSASTLLDGSTELRPGVRTDLMMTILEEAVRLNRLVSNLLNMTRLESGGLRPSLDLYSIQEVIASALEHSNVNGRPVAVLADDELPLIPFDYALIEQVLLNLFENAIKYSPAGTPLTISADAQDGRMVVTVADRGPGIRKEDIERVFDKFYRAGDTGVPGTGLGLTICKGIVQAHGGTICARPRKGGGTEICFTLPLT